MLCWISIFGGLLIMMGQHDGSEALFYYFRVEDQVPENHLLRLIDKHVSFEFVRQRLKDSYSETGRPSIDPELLLRIVLIGYLYGISSERKLVEELRMHLAWRWFTGLGFVQGIPHHSTFSKNRHGRAAAHAHKKHNATGRYKYLAIHIHESVRQRARELANTAEFAKAQRQRKKVEALFAELKNQIGLRRLRLRRMKFAREPFFLAAAAQNIKRLVQFLSQPITPVAQATA
jgi:transposase